MLVYNLPLIARKELNVRAASIVRKMWRSDVSPV